MSRADAARKLLAHGPLSFRDFHAITGWPYHACRKVISKLQEDGWVVSEDKQWRLA